MYTFGDLSSQKQKHQTVDLPTEYLVLNSEPEDDMNPGNAKQTSPRLYVNHYLAKRHVMRTIHQMRRGN